VDIQRPPRPNRRPYVYAGMVASLVAATVGFGHLRPAAPTVERATLWTDTVKRGPMLREGGAPEPWFPSRCAGSRRVTAGRIERILVRAGTPVDENAELLELSNPDVQLEALDADRQLTLAQAEQASLESALQNGVLSQEGV